VYFADYAILCTLRDTSLLHLLYISCISPVHFCFIQLNFFIVFIVVSEKFYTFALQNARKGKKYQRGRNEISRKEHQPLLHCTIIRLQCTDDG